MRQDVARKGSEPARIAGLTTVTAFLLIALASGASAGDGDVPDLAKPSEMPPIVSTPTTPGSATPRPATPPGDRAVLALPGITTPASPKPGAASPPIVSSPSTDSSPGGLRLDAPLEMKGTPTPLTPLPRVTPSPTPSPGRSPRPLVLESPDEEPVPIDGAPSRTNPSTKRPSTTPRIDPQPAPPAQKRGRLFGLLPGPAPSPAPAPTPASSTSTGAGSSMAGRSNVPGRSVVDGPQSDTAAESALKRRIEKQAREAVGDRARTIDVRIVGKVAVVQARGVKLFQKRGVRKSLESMPGLSGLRTSIEVLD
jgi:hypothetical protein